MGGSPHLSERQHVQHAPFPSPHLNPQYPVSAARGNGLVDSRQSPDTDRHASRRPVPAPSTSSHSRAETGPSDLSYKLDDQPGSLVPLRNIASPSQTQEPSGSSNNLAVQPGHSPKQSQPHPRPTGARHLPTIDSHESRINSNPRDHGTDSSTIPKSSPTMLVGQKRTAMGVAKPANSPHHPYSKGQEATSGRRRSESIGSLSHGNRIAALSVHLRTRLSYAASKIEKSRQANNARFPMGLLDNNSRIPPSDLDSLKRMGLYPNSDESSGFQAMDMNSPDGTTVSAPDPSAPSQSHFQRELSRASPILRSGSSTPFTSQHDRSRSHGSTPTIPRLAPPADIIPKSSSSRRRRPNPNEPLNPHRYSPFPLHRRHHSQQEFSLSKPATNSETILVPGTPPLQPQSGVDSTPYGSLSSRHIHGTAMEQDAIETLLFMSSPGHSGYQSNSQTSQPQPSLIRNSISNSIDSMSSSRWGQESHRKDGSDQSRSHGHGSNAGLESQAGDEIDRMLDQMDSDSEDEKAFPRHHSDSLSTNSLQKKSSGGRETPGES